MKIAQKPEVVFNGDILAFYQLNSCKTWWTGTWALPSGSRSAALPWNKKEELAQSLSLEGQKLLEDLTVIRWMPPSVSSGICAHQHLLIIHVILSSWGYCWIKHLLPWLCSLCICVPHTTACVIPAIKSLPKRCVNIYFSGIVGCFPMLSFFDLVIRNLPVFKFLSLWSHSYSPYSQFCCAGVCLSIGIVGPRLTFCIKGAVLAPDSQTWEVCRGFPSSIGKLQSSPQALSS